MRPAGFKHYIQRKSRQQSSVDPPPLNIEPVPVPPSFQHPHSYLPPNAYAALAAGAANLKYALSGPVWDHSLSRQFSQECLAQFEPPAIAQRPKSPSPPASTRSSQISPKMKRPVVSSRRKENAVQRKDSHVDAGSNLSRDSVKKASLKHIVFQTKFLNLRVHSTNTLYRMTTSPAIDDATATLLLTAPTSLTARIVHHLNSNVPFRIQTQNMPMMRHQRRPRRARAVM